MSIILLTLSLLVGVSFSNVTFKKFLILQGSAVLYDITSYCLTAAIMFLFLSCFCACKSFIVLYTCGLCCYDFFVEYNQTCVRPFPFLQSAVRLYLWLIKSALYNYYMDLLFFHCAPFRRRGDCQSEEEGYSYTSGAVL